MGVILTLHTDDFTIRYIIQLSQLLWDVGHLLLSDDLRTAVHMVCLTSPDALILEKPNSLDVCFLNSSLNGHRYQV